MNSSLILSRSLEIWRHFRAGRGRAVRTYLREIDHNHVHILSHSPPVVMAWLGRDDSALHQALANHPLVVLYLVPFAIEEHTAKEFSSKALATLKRFPKHRVVLLCNEAHTVKMISREGVEAVFCNHNALVNEAHFRILPEVGKTHDAIYNAALAPYKRWELTLALDSLLALGYAVSWMNADTYAGEMRQQLTSATWLVDARQDSEKLPPSALPAIYNRAEVGLCLSASEGAMFASIEYLLCGLPVVSTQSRGGRDVFWDDRFVLLAEPSAASVAAAVRELKSRKIDPNLVRAATIEKMNAHRTRLKAYLNPVISDYACPWPPGNHGITSFRGLRDVAAEIRQKSVHQ